MEQTGTKFIKFHEPAKGQEDFFFLPLQKEGSLSIFFYLCTPNTFTMSFQRNRLPENRRKKEAAVQGKPQSAAVQKLHGPVRLNRCIALSGVCSRREADEKITQGLVTVNGKPVKELGTQVQPGDMVKLEGRLIKPEKPVYILLNKPKDTITTLRDPQGRQTVLDLIGKANHPRVFPVGRLDRNTTGVLLLTNDGELARKLAHPSSRAAKVYEVTLDKKLREADVQQLLEGITLEDGRIRADRLSFPDAADHSRVGLEIHSGRNRIVRRMFEHLGYRIRKLDRVYFAGLTKKGLSRGKWRYLSRGEIQSLKMGRFQ